MNLPNWLTFELTIGWATLFKLMFFLLVWNLGFYAITRKGKLLHFILDFFEQKKEIEIPLAPGGNEHVDRDILKSLEPLIGKGERAQEKQVSDFLKFNTSGVYSKHRAAYVLARILRPIEFKGEENEYFIKKKVNKLPDWLIDPIVVCITCMASFHGLIVFITYCAYKDIPWNPLLQLAISVPVAFLGEFSWYLKQLIEKHKK